MSDDADLIRRMMLAWFRNEKSDNFENLMELCRDDMARVLAVVRAHDAGPAPHEQAQADATDIPTFGTLTIGTPYIPDIWQKTNNLRWNGGTLEQQWLNSTGKTQWEPVPTKDPTHD